MENKENVLFLCTGNSARSQMAEAFLLRFAGERFEVYSAGLEPKGINPLTIQVMNEMGYDLAGHSSKPVSQFLMKTHIHYLITVCDHAEKNCPSVWPGVVKRLHWSFEDPAAAQGTQEEQLAVFRQVRDQIERAIFDWVMEFNPPSQP